MNATLPQGLITISHSSVPPSNESQPADILFERTQILHSFWKVHAIRHRVSKDLSDYRCQNLFWRAWGDSTLSKTITTATLTSLWTSCQQEIDLISVSKEIDACLSHIRSKTKQIQSHVTQATAANQRNEKDIAEDASVLTPNAVSLQPSLLACRSKERRTSTEESGGPGTPSEAGRKSSRTPRPTLARTGSANTRTSFSGVAARSKGRPSFGQRKSSQGLLQTKPPKPHKGIVKSPTISTNETDNPEALPSITTTSAFELPSASSWEDDELVIDSNRLSTSDTYKGSPPELVEPNFRNKFAERIASSSNLSSMSKIKKTGSVVRFADEIPMDFKRPKEPELRPTAETDLRSLMSHRGSTASIAVIDEDENDFPSPMLPRTKSQLTMMIDESRAQFGQVTRKSPTTSENFGLSSRRRKEPTDTEKVLAMAHGEGVTRAGGRQIRRGFKFGGEDESRYSSPSPPPLF